MTRRRIDAFFLEKGILTQEQCDEALEYSQRTGLRFDAAAMELQFISRETLIKIFGSNHAVDFFYLEPQYFPKDTQDLLDVPTSLETGALLLGYKTKKRLFGNSTSKTLNVGLLNPGRRKDALEKIRNKILNKIRGDIGVGDLEFKIFLILADQYLDVMRQVYHVEADQIEQIVDRDSEHKLDQTLAMYLS